MTNKLNVECLFARMANKPDGSRRILACRISHSSTTKAANTVSVIKDEMARNHGSIYCHRLSVHQV